MNTTEVSLADRRYAMFVTMVHTGALATLLLFATIIFDLPGFVDGLPIGLLLVALGVILNRKLRDDYVEQLWKAGTAAAFIAVIACSLVLPVAYGMLDDVLGGDTTWREFTIPVQLPAAVALTGFYIGFYWRMLAGGHEA
ncbi:MAG: hypothetical protein GW855_01860 [Erythrobacter sp.]|nr:hypothetical protein [Erythrobacter sp.]NCQ64576.1 hypothetical protein [Alphaproteobacteria bacterium]